MSQKIPGSVLVAFSLSILTLSQAAILVRLAAAPAEMLGFWRMIFATALTLILLLFSREKGWISYLQKNRKPIFISGFFFFVHFWLWFHAVQNTKVANAVILFNMNPVFTSALAVYLGREKMTWPLFIALFLGLFGLAIMEWDAMQFGGAGFKGDLLAVASGVCFAFYVLSTKSLRVTGHNLTLTLGFNVICVVGFFLASLFKGHAFGGYPTVSWLSFIGMAIGPSLLGHALFTYSLKYLKASVASCFKLAEPVFAAFTAAMLFGENLARATVIGFVFIAAGLINLFLRARA